MLEYDELAFLEEDVYYEFTVLEMLESYDLYDLLFLFLAAGAGFKYSLLKSKGDSESEAQEEIEV